MSPYLWNSANLGKWVCFRTQKQFLLSQESFSKPANIFPICI